MLEPRTSREARVSSLCGVQACSIALARIGTSYETKKTRSQNRTSRTIRTTMTTPYPGSQSMHTLTSTTKVVPRCKSALTGHLMTPIPLTPRGSTERQKSRHSSGIDRRERRAFSSNVLTIVQLGEPQEKNKTNRLKAEKELLARGATQDFMRDLS